MSTYMDGVCKFCRYQTNPYNKQDQYFQWYKYLPPIKLVELVSCLVCIWRHHRLRLLFVPYSNPYLFGFVQINNDWDMKTKEFCTLYKIRNCSLKFYSDSRTTYTVVSAVKERTQRFSLRELVSLFKGH